MSMAAGEFESVHAQADSEDADLARECSELKVDDKGEHEELTAIYVSRGLDPALAKKVADQLMAHDAVGAHARDELGISENPVGAALRHHAALAHSRHSHSRHSHLRARAWAKYPELKMTIGSALILPWGNSCANFRRVLIFAAPRRSARRAQRD
jgi:VIT1/CCC1 family predicted Fe2+/Mn2+ transporter